MIIETEVDAAGVALGEVLELDVAGLNEADDRDLLGGGASGVVGGKGGVVGGSRGEALDPGVALVVRGAGAEVDLSNGLARGELGLGVGVEFRGVAVDELGIGVAADDVGLVDLPVVSRDGEALHLGHFKGEADAPADGSDGFEREVAGGEALHDIGAVADGLGAVGVSGTGGAVDDEAGRSVEGGQIWGGETLVEGRAHHQAVVRFPIQAGLGAGGGAEVAVVFIAGRARELERVEQRNFPLGGEDGDDRFDVAAVNDAVAGGVGGVGGDEVIVVVFGEADARGIAADVGGAQIEILLVPVFGAGGEGDGVAPVAEDRAGGAGIEAGDRAETVVAPFLHEGIEDGLRVGVGLVGDDGVARDFEGVAEGIVGGVVGAQERFLEERFARGVVGNVTGVRAGVDGGGFPGPIVQDPTAQASDAAVDAGVYLDGFAAEILEEDGDEGGGLRGAGEARRAVGIGCAGGAVEARAVRVERIVDADGRELVGAGGVDLNGLALEVGFGVVEGEIAEGGDAVGEVILDVGKPVFTVRFTLAGVLILVEIGEGFRIGRAVRRGSNGGEGERAVDRAEEVSCG